VAGRYQCLQHHAPRTDSGTGWFRLASGCMCMHAAVVAQVVEVLFETAARRPLVRVTPAEAPRPHRLYPYV
jgi:hypothetical protein